MLLTIPTATEEITDSTFIGEIELTLYLSKQSYRIGEDVEIRWITTNPSTSNYTLPDRPNIDLEILNSTTLVWATDRDKISRRDARGEPLGLPPSSTPITLEPGEVIMNELSWNMTQRRSVCGRDGNVSFCNFVDDLHVAPGEYVLILHFELDENREFQSLDRLKYSLAVRFSIIS